MPETASAPPPTVSIVIPAFNRANTLRAAVDSVLTQTFEDFELLIVNDGSQDATMAIAADISDPRIRLLENPHNMGAGAARNTGIRAARGTWIAFQDSDDEWLPHKLERQMARLTAPGADFVAAYCGMLVIGTVALVKKATPTVRPHIDYLPAIDTHQVEGDLRQTLLAGNLISTQTLIARRDMLERIGGFDETLPAVEDWDCALRLAQLGDIACVDEPLVLQRFSTNSLSHQLFQRLKARNAIIEKHRALYVDDPALLARLHAGHAVMYARLGNRSEARTAMRKSLALQPLSPRLWGRALTYALPGRPVTSG